MKSSLLLGAALLSGVAFGQYCTVASNSTSCGGGDEFDRQRCVNSRSLAQGAVARSAFVSVTRTRLGPLDFRTRRFPVDVPRLGWFTLDLSTGTSDVDGNVQRAESRMRIQTSDHLSTVAIEDPAQAEAIRKAGAPFAVLLLQGRGFDQRNVTDDPFEILEWDLMGPSGTVPPRFLNRGDSFDWRREKVWRYAFSRIGAQILSRVDGSILLSVPPAIDMRNEDPIECAEIEQDPRRRAAFQVRTLFLQAALDALPFVGNLNF